MGIASLNPSYALLKVPSRMLERLMMALLFQ
jgi:hypothetical protein